MSELTREEVEAMRERPRDLRGHRFGQYAGVELLIRDIETLATALLAAWGERDEARDGLEQHRVQLAGCLTAAEGWSKEPATRGMYGWSPAYQATLDLRTRADRAVAENRRLREVVRDAARAVARVDLTAAESILIRALTDEGGPDAE